MTQEVVIHSATGIIAKDENQNQFIGSGDTVPTDGETGFQNGALFFHTDGGVGSSVYINEGTDSSCAFKAMPIVNTTQAYINLPFTIWREVTSDDITNVAGNGGVLATDSTPPLEYVNGDIDSMHRVNWAAADQTPITVAFGLPPDMDRTADMVLHFYAEMSGATDTPTVDMDTFFDVGDTKVEDASAALADAVAELTITVAAADIPDTALTCAIELTPGSHGTDTLAMYAGAWIEYTRKTLTS